MPRSKTMRVVFSGVMCWIRKARDGTVNLMSGSEGTTKNFSGMVRLPALRACTETVAIISRPSDL